MKSGQDQFNARNLFFRVNIHRHAAAVICNLNTSILVKGYLDSAGIAGERFVHAVVHNLLDQMVGTGSIRIHARPSPDRIEPG